MPGYIDFEIRDDGTRHYPAGCRTEDVPGAFGCANVRVLDDGPANDRDYELELTFPEPSRFGGTVSITTTRDQTAPGYLPFAQVGLGVTAPIGTSGEKEPYTGTAAPPGSTDFTVTQASVQLDAEYDNGTGRFLVPADPLGPDDPGAMPGTWRVDVTAPEGHVFRSNVTATVAPNADGENVATAGLEARIQPGTDTATAFDVEVIELGEMQFTLRNLDGPITPGDNGALPFTMSSTPRRRAR